MIILYGTPLSTYCAKVRVILRHKAIPFEEREPPEGYGSAAYKAIVPMGSVPGLVDGDIVISESEAIAEYLNEKSPNPPMLPGNAGERAYIRALSRIHDCWVEPQLRALYPVVKATERDGATIRLHVGQFHRRLNDMADMVTPAPYLAGDQLTLADCAWPTTLIQAQLLFAALGMELETPQTLQPWREHLANERVIAPEIRACERAMHAWLSRFIARS